MQRSSVLGSPRPTRRRCDKVHIGTPLKKQKYRAIVPAPSPARSSPSVEDEEYFAVDGPEFDDDEENERCNCTHVEVIFVESEEGVNESTRVGTMANWYKQGDPWPLTAFLTPLASTPRTA